MAQVQPTPLGRQRKNNNDERFIFHLTVSSCDSPSLRQFIKTSFLAGQILSFSLRFSPWTATTEETGANKGFAIMAANK